MLKIILYAKQFVNKPIVYDNVHVQQFKNNVQENKKQNKSHTKCYLLLDKHEDIILHKKLHLKHQYCRKHNARAYKLIIYNNTFS